MLLVCVCVAMGVLALDQWSKAWASAHLASPTHPLMVRAGGTRTIEQQFASLGVTPEELSAKIAARQLWLYRPLRTEEFALERGHTDAPRQLLWAGNSVGPAPRGLYLTLQDGNANVANIIRAKLRKEHLDPQDFWVMDSPIDRGDRSLALGHVAALLQREISVMTPGVELVYAENPGAAWGALRDLSDGFRTSLFAVIALIAIILLFWLVRSTPTLVVAICAGSVIGGALGNLLDRLRFSVVIDFILHAVGQWRWPVYNIADVGISAGGFILCIYLVTGARVRAASPTS